MIGTAVLLFTSTAYAEHVFLKNGAIIKGTVTGETADELTLDLQNGAVKTYQQKDIIRVLYTELYLGVQYVRLVDGKVIQAYMVDEDQNSYTFRKNLYSPEEFKIPRADVLFIARNNPNKLAGKADYTSAELTWLPPMGEVKEYRIYVKEKFGAYPKKPAGTTTGTRYTVKDLKSCTEYRMIVTAVNEKGKESLPSNEIELETINYAPDAPGRPRHIIAADRGKGLVDVDVAWPAAADRDGTVAAYNVYLKKAKDREFSRAARIAAPAKAVEPGEISHTFKGIADKTEYVMAVTALDAKNAESDKSALLNFSTRNTPPNPPRQVNKTRELSAGGRKVDIRLSWNEASDPDGRVLKYRVYRKAARNVRLGETADTVFTAKNIDAAENPDFIVTAIDNRGAESEAYALKKLVSPGVNLLARTIFLCPLGDFADMYDAAAGAAVFFSFDSFAAHGLALGIETGYWKLMPGHELIGSSYMVPVLAEISYSFDITRFFRIGMYASGGGAYSSVTHAKKYMPVYDVTRETETSFDGIVSGGLLCEFVIKSRLVVDVKIGYLAILEAEPMHCMIFGAGIGYRFDMPGR